MGVAPQLTERVNRRHVNRLTIAAVIAVLENVNEEWSGAFVTRRSERLHDRLASAVIGGFERLLKGGIRFGGANLHEATRSFTLNGRLRILEESGQSGQRLHTANRAQQFDGGSPHGRVRGHAQLVRVKVT